MRALQWFVWAFAWVAGILCAAWAFGAIYFDFPIAGRSVAILFGLFLFATIVFVRRALLKLTIVLGGFLLVACWWFTLRPGNDRPWQKDVEQTAWADVQGDLVTIHNVRNCDYHTESDFTPHWETRTVRLSHITGMDLAINYWGSPWMAHPIVIFRFDDTLPLCFSIEIRRTIGQTYSALRGLYRQYPLICIVADERDVIRVRTNYRGEDVYLYHTRASPDQARERFLEYLNTIDSLRDHPRWYNALTSNCTTNIRTQRSVNERAPWDWRIILNGKADEMLYERRAIVTAGLPFAEIKRRSLINQRARAADQAPDFSHLIREDLPSGY